MATKKTSKASAFPGFGQPALAFLRELSTHNDKKWFDANKERYESTIREPALDFIRAMGPALAKISRQLTADDRKIGGSLMRVHRDVRFSKDKRPYKTNIGIQFRHVAGKDVHAPGCYIHIALDGCFLGMGMYHPDNDALAKIRARIDDKQAAWKKVSTDDKLLAHFRLGGDSLARPPRGYDKDHPFVDDLRRKDHILMCEITPKQALSKDLPDLCMERFAAGKPHMKFLCDAIGLPF